MTQPSTEVDITGNATLQRAADLAVYDPDLDFRKLIAEAGPDAYYSRGFRLIDKDSLIGVPHVIIGVTFRQGYKRPDGTFGDYCSIEAVIADKDTLDSNPVRHQLQGELAVWPNESVVYNDGGTGVRRVHVQNFTKAGIIDPGPAKGTENPFDKPYQSWANGMERGETGIVADLNGVPYRYVAIRGLRVSEYENEYGPGRTFYYA